MKRDKGSKSFSVFTSFLLIGSLLLPGMASAGPTTALPTPSQVTVVGGSAVASNPTATTLQLTQSTNRAIYTSATLGVPSLSTIQFSKASALPSAAALYLVQGGTPVIGGKILSDPNVTAYIQSGNSFILQSGATVNGAALITSHTPDLANNSAFMTTGSPRLSGAPGLSITGPVPSGLIPLSPDVWASSVTLPMGVTWVSPPVPGGSASGPTSTVATPSSIAGGLPPGASAFGFGLTTNSSGQRVLSLPKNASAFLAAYRSSNNTFTMPANMNFGNGTFSHTGMGNFSLPSSMANFNPSSFMNMSAMPAGLNGIHPVSAPPGVPMWGAPPSVGTSFNTPKGQVTITGEHSFTLNGQAGTFNAKSGTATVGGQTFTAPSAPPSGSHEASPSGQPSAPGNAPSSSAPAAPADLAPAAPSTAAPSGTAAPSAAPADKQNDQQKAPANQ